MTENSNCDPKNDDEITEHNGETSFPVDKEEVGKTIFHAV